jgi:hypothetical protein
MLKLALSLAFPAAGMVLAALGQVGLTALWPGIRMVPFGAVSIDSYLVVLLAVGLCFLAGCWTRRNVPTSIGAACALIAPLLWLMTLIKGTLLAATGQILWFRPLVLFTLFTAFAPLVAVGLGLALSSLTAAKNCQ